MLHNAGAKKKQTHEPFTCLCTHNFYDSSCTSLFNYMHPFARSPLKKSILTSILTVFHQLNHKRHTLRLDKDTLRQGFQHLPCLITFQQGSPHIVAPTTSAFQKFMVFPLRLRAVSDVFFGGRRWSNSSERKTTNQKKHNAFFFVLFVFKLKD